MYAMPRMLVDGTPITSPLLSKAQWNALCAGAPGRPEPTDAEREREHRAAKPFRSLPRPAVLDEDMYELHGRGWSDEDIEELAGRKAPWNREAK